MASRNRPELYGSSAAAAFLQLDRKRLYDLTPAANVHEVGGRVHPLYDLRDLIEYKAELAAAKAERVSA
jgi:hypothetical protein